MSTDAQYNLITKQFDAYVAGIAQVAERVTSAAQATCARMSEMADDVAEVGTQISAAMARPLTAATAAPHEPPSD